MIKDEIPRHLFTTGYIAELLKISRKTVIDLEQYFGIVPNRVQRGHGKVRKYTIDQVNQFKAIWNLIKEDGHTWEGARKQLQSKENQNKFWNKVFK